MHVEYAVKYQTKNMFDFIKMHPIELLPGFLMGAIGAFFAPIGMWLFVIIILIFFDHITGLRKAKRNGIERTSKKAMASVDKILHYVIVIISCHLVDSWAFPMINLVPEAAPNAIKEAARYYLTWPATGYLMYRELWSIMENTDTVTGVGIAEHMKARLKRFYNFFK